ncbi:MAG: hypothetical protein JNN03_13690 [Rubrivivax sp.]|nr:hypothetical protein [Rubrivivax sp.]
MASTHIQLADSSRAATDKRHGWRNARHWSAAMLAGFGMLIQIGCGGSEEAATDRSSDLSAPLAKVVLENQSDSEARFGLVINGRSFFSTEDDVLNEVVGSGPRPSEPDLAVALWKFVRDNRYHFEPYSPHRWSHAPVVYFNSIGFGLCDDAASVYRALATRAGLESRVWFLSGHVVAEAKVLGRWAVFDPDLEAYYLDREGRIAGVEQLAQDPSLISSPVAPFTDVSRLLWDFMLPIEPSIATSIAPAYSAYAVALYATDSDNHVEPWYDEVPVIAFDPEPFVLPPGARLVIDAQGHSTSVKSWNGLTAPRAASIRLELAAGWSGTIRLPLIISAAHGSGLVRLEDRIVALGSLELEQHLALRDRAVNSLEVVRAEAGDQVTLLVNQSRFRLDELRDVRVLGARAGAVSVVRTLQDVP